MKVSLIYKLKLIIFTLIAWTSIAKANDITKNNILGLWRMEDFTIVENNGHKKKWADEAHGTLLYTADNFMSVSINGMRGEEFVYLFYSGNYIVCKNNFIKHRVGNATDPDRINKIMIRSAAYKNGILTLTANGNYGKAIIEWKKINLSD